MNIIPSTTEKITELWLTNALRSSHTFESAEVIAFKLESLDIEGTVGITLRVRMEFADPKEHLPSTLILKMASPKVEFRKVIAQKRMYEREVRFYQDLAGQTEIQTPACYYSAINESGEQFVLLLEDLDPMRVGDQIAGCTKLEAELAIVALAKLHAAFWNSQILEDVSWAPKDHGPEQMDQEAYLQRFWPKCMENMSDILGDAFKKIGQSYGTAIPELAIKKSRLPQTIMHGDFRLDNLLFDSSKAGDAFAAIDWQALKQGCGLCDVAYFISFNLTTDLRREIEQSLLNLYHETLIQNGIDDYAIEKCRSDFRLGLIYPLYILIFAGSNADQPSKRLFELLDVSCARLTAALEDHDILELIESSVRVQ